MSKPIVAIIGNFNVDKQWKFAVGESLGPLLPFPPVLLEALILFSKKVLPCNMMEVCIRLNYYIFL